MDNYIDAYDEQQWNQLATPVVKDNTAIDTEQEIQAPTESKKQKKKSVSSPVLTIQLVICLLALTLLFVFKTFAFDIYSNVMLWYNTEIKASLYFSGDFSQIDYSGLFNSTEDEI